MDRRGRIARSAPFRFLERSANLLFGINRKMLVLEMLRDARGLFGLDLFRRFVQRVVSFAAFLCPTHVSGGVGEGNSCFGHADELDGLLRRDREWQRFRIGQTNVFTRENDDAPGDEAKIFAGMQHFREPVHRVLFVRRAHALDERADRVVVGVAGAVVDDRFLLNAFFRDRDGEMNRARANLAAL